MLSFAMVVLDVVMGKVSMLTVMSAREVLAMRRAMGLDDLDFHLVLASALLDVDLDDWASWPKKSLFATWEVSHDGHGCSAVARKWFSILFDRFTM